MAEWFNKYGDQVQKFAALTKPEQSHKFLQENINLVCDHMASYLVIYCVDLEVEGVSFGGGKVQNTVPLLTSLPFLLT